MILCTTVAAIGTNLDSAAPSGPSSIMSSLAALVRFLDGSKHSPTWRAILDSWIVRLKTETQTSFSNSTWASTARFVGFMLVKRSKYRAMV